MDNTNYSRQDILHSSYLVYSSLFYILFLLFNDSLKRYFTDKYYFVTQFHLMKTQTHQTANFDKKKTLFLF
jgi:hypothetical protein